MRRLFAMGLFAQSLFSLTEVYAQSKIATIESRKTIVVAVIDTGIDVEHPQLKNCIFQNKGELGFDSKGRDKRFNNIDDDGNGYVDDYEGWNFVDESNNIADNLGHGTHIAGIIAGTTNKYKRVLASQSLIKILPIKFYDISASNSINFTQTTVKAINYAIDMKVDVINYSGGGMVSDFRERQAIERANSRGILFVAAAGNDAKNIDRARFYPASYNLPNIISVGALAGNNLPLRLSNYGSKNVDLSAPGSDIQSTVPGGKVGKMTGTSQATAFVTAAATMLRALLDKTISPEKIKLHLMKNSNFLPSLKGMNRSDGALNALKALRSSQALL